MLFIDNNESYIFFVSVAHCSACSKNITAEMKYTSCGIYTPECKCIEVTL